MTPHKVVCTTHSDIFTAHYEVATAHKEVFTAQKPSFYCTQRSCLLHIKKFLLHITKFVLHIKKFLLRITKFVLHIKKFLLHITKLVLHVMKFVTIAAKKDTYDSCGVPYQSSVDAVCTAVWTKRRITKSTEFCTYRIVPNCFDSLEPVGIILNLSTPNINMAWMPLGCFSEKRIQTET